MVQLVEEAEKGMEGAGSVADEVAPGVESSTHGDNGELPSDKEAAAAASQNGE